VLKVLINPLKGSKAMFDKTKEETQEKPRSATSSPDRRIHLMRQDIERRILSAQTERERMEGQDTNGEKPSPIDYIKTLGDSLLFIPQEHHTLIKNADERAKKAFHTAATKERRKPEDLRKFGETHYNVDPHKAKNRALYFFNSKEHPIDNLFSIEIKIDEGILNSSSSMHFIKNKDKPYISDLQRYVCIKDDWTEIPIKEYQSELVNNDNTLKVVKALLLANARLRPDTATDNTLTLTRGSAAFTAFLGAEVNLSKIFLASDLGRRIQSVSIELEAYGKEQFMQFKFKFVPDE
jgi:hypothetical protein